jgi:hypothetical protein
MHLIPQKHEVKGKWPQSKIHLVCSECNWLFQSNVVTEIMVSSGQTPGTVMPVQLSGEDAPCQPTGFHMRLDFVGFLLWHKFVPCGLESITHAQSRTILKAQRGASNLVKVFRSVTSICQGLVVWLTYGLTRVCNYKHNSSGPRNGSKILACLKEWTGCWWYRKAVLHACIVLKWQTKGKYCL